ncbi:uncharacterized protein DNG_00795 [Cephalotrichum gorgonifer]|uniref:Uncharacterized protein n=1 Tax=Cephalotrichum gorgonifer TaxID=2041049 RepID=A0AAE8MQJ5_9PEZI|nr:uncharacterized protein DNG_00795 [Cephalotrichum gorgonifer]
MTVRPCPAETNSSTEDASPDRNFLNEDSLAATSGSTEYRVSPLNRGEGVTFVQGGHGSAASPLDSDVSSTGTPGASAGTPPVMREAALARIISHGYSTLGTSNGKSPSSANRVDIFEILPTVLNAQGRAVCQHHEENGICDCEAFPLVRIDFPLPMARSNRVCYPIQEVDESQTEYQPVSDAQHTRKVSPRGPTKDQQDEDKHQVEAERFKGLLGKLRKSAEDKCSRIIKEWKDPITGRSEPLASWDKNTYLAWSRRLNEYKDLVNNKYAPRSERPEVKGVEVQSSPSSTVPKQSVREAVGSDKPSLNETKMDVPEPKLRTAWNPEAKEFLPPKDSTTLGTLGAASQGAKAREMLSEFVSRAKARCNGNIGGSKTANLTGAVSTQPAFVPRTASFAPETLTPPFGLGSSLAQMFACVPPLAFPTPHIPDAALAGLNTPGLGSSKFDFNPLGGTGAFNRTLGAVLAGTPGVGAPGPAGLAGVSFGPQRPFSQGFPGATGILPPAPSRMPPGPVPKPRMPDAQGQQQYEQWIEWRKANEPGYALECKARQARRAQRAKTTSVSSFKGESETRGGTSRSGGGSESRGGNSKTD